MYFLFFISGVAGGALALGLTGVFLSSALLAVGFRLLGAYVPSNQSALRETTTVDIHTL